MRGLVIMLSLLVACSAAPTAAGSTTGAAATAAEREPIRLPLSLYLVVEGDRSGDGASATPALSTRRTADELADIGRAVNQIWAQAGLVFEPVEIRTVQLPREVLLAIVSTGDTEPFFSQLGRSFDVPDPSLLNGFYVSAAFGANGFTPLSSRVFFVVDEPTVHDERVSSHELGHILGLHHNLNDSDRLMFSGTNGMTLDVQEQEVARYAAQGLLDGRS